MLFGACGTNADDGSVSVVRFEGQNDVGHPDLLVLGDGVEQVCKDVE
jgi:hypothetical protein